MAQLGNLLVKGSSRFLNKAYFEDVYICGDVSTGGELNIATNDSRKANLSLNGKRALRGYDSWLRINEDRHFGDGIYCGNGILRTDGEFQVGTNGNKFKVNTSSLASYVPSTFSAQATFNGGLIASSANISEEICNTLIVKDELRSAKWSIDNITNLGSTFYVSPCIIFTNPSVYVNSISGTTVVLTITDNSITSSTIGGATWTNGSKIKLMGRIGNSALGTINGVLKRDLNSSTAKTAYISLDFPNTNLIKFSAGATYSGSNVGDLKMMMYEVNKNVNGTTKNRPIGILLSSYGENKKPCIDIYNGDIEDGSPVVRMGYLNGLPSVNGVNPTGYGFYAAGNAYFSGTLVSSSGKIGGFSLSEYTFLGGSGTDIIGICSTPGQEQAIWTGSTVSYSAPFRVTHSGTLYASNATIKGNITATSGKIGGCDISNGVLSITNANSTYAEFNGDGKTNGYFHIATIKITGNYIDRAMVIGAQSRGYGYSEINLQFINANSVDPGLNFFNQTGRGDWYIKKTATSTWNIYCKKSEDWGYTRILKYIDSPHVTLTWGTGNADLPSGSIRATQLAGSSAWCYNNDSTYIDGGNIYAGTVTADKITANNISGTNGWINLRSGLFDYGNGKLKWDGTSLSITGNGKFAGEITARSGRVGKYNITNNYLISGSGSTCTGMGGNQAFWAGSDSSNDAPFHVSYDGSLYASKANISGVINSTDGSIGGWKIENSSIYAKSTDGLKQTSLNSDSQKIEFKLTRPATAESDESSSFLNISNSNLSPYIELGWMTTDFDGNAYWGNRTYISEDSIAIYSKADIDSSVTISSNDIILSDTGDKLTISPGYLQFENGVSISPNQNVLWEGVADVNGTQTISLNDKISRQLFGIVLVWSGYSNGKANNGDVHTQFIPKWCVTGKSMAFCMTDAYRHINKYFYVYDDKIVGNNINGTNGTEGGITYNNRNCVLRAVIGV